MTGSKSVLKKKSLGSNVNVQMYVRTSLVSFVAFAKSWSLEEN